MSLRVLFPAAFLCLAACAQAGELAEAAHLPLTHATTAVEVGQRAVFQVGLVAGDVMVENVGVAEFSGRSWNADADDSTNKAHALKPPPGFKVGSTCTFALVEEHGQPTLPLQAIAVDNLSPCFPVSDFGMQNLAGRVTGFRDVEVCFDGALIMIKAPVLTDVSFDLTAIENSSRPLDIPLRLSDEAVENALQQSNASGLVSAIEGKPCS